jgi:hypothetical protein
LGGFSSVGVTGALLFQKNEEREKSREERERKRKKRELEHRK